MTYGLNVTDAQGQTVFSTEGLYGIAADFIYTAPGQSGSRSYPHLAGLTLDYFPYILGLISSQPGVEPPYPRPTYMAATISYPGGIPTLSWALPTSTASPPILFLVFAR